MIVISCDPNGNLAWGENALAWNSGGYDNIAIGSSSLVRLNKDCSTASNNIAIGGRSQAQTHSGSRNISIGTESLYGNIETDLLHDCIYQVTAGWTLPLTSPNDGLLSKDADGTDAAVVSVNPNAAKLTEIGIWYTVAYTITNMTAGTATVSMGGVSDTARTSNGDYSFTFEAVATDVFSVTPSNSARFEIKATVLIDQSHSPMGVASSNVAIGTGASYFNMQGENNVVIGEVADFNICLVRNSLARRVSAKVIKSGI